jgi:hypothetical protein
VLGEADVYSGAVFAHPESTGLRHETLSVRLHQPSSCQLHSRQFADDCVNNRDDNSSSDEHNDVDVRNFYRRDDKRSIAFHADYR